MPAAPNHLPILSLPATPPKSHELSPAPPGLCRVASSPWDAFFLLVHPANAHCASRLSSQNTRYDAFLLNQLLHPQPASTCPAWVTLPTVLSPGPCAWPSPHLPFVLSLPVYLPASASESQGMRSYRPGVGYPCVSSMVPMTNCQTFQAPAVTLSPILSAYLQCALGAGHILRTAQQPPCPVFWNAHSWDTPSRNPSTML